MKTGIPLNLAPFWFDPELAPNSTMSTLIETNANFAANLKGSDDRLDMNDQNVVAIMHGSGII